MGKIKQEKKPEESREKRGEMKAEREESLFRILSTDIPGSKSVYAGLTKIKGISWGVSNAICNILGIDKNKKISELNEQEIGKISELTKNTKVPVFILNRRKDFDSGINEHLIGSDLDLRKEFDIKRMKKMRSYRGVRHILGQPVRGQRTKSHFRKNKTVGVMGKAKPGKKS